MQKRNRRLNVLPLFQLMGIFILVLLVSAAFFMLVANIPLLNITAHAKGFESAHVPISILGFGAGGTTMKKILVGIGLVMLVFAFAMVRRQIREDVNKRK